MTISKELLLTVCADLGIELDERICDMFDLYAEMLIDYNKKVNLTAITSPDDIVTKHFADSLCLTKFVDLGGKKRLCDVGTGAGFPGVALLIYNPQLSVSLFDSVNKKLDFIRFLLSQLNLSADVNSIRAEDAAHSPLYRESFDVVTARAVAQLNVLAECCVPLVKLGGVFAPMKAVLSADEKAAGVNAARLLGAGEHSSYLYSVPGAGEREVLVFKKVSQSLIKYPRNYSQIMKKPL